MNDASNNTPRGLIAAVVNKFLTSQLAVILIILAVCMGIAAILITPREEEPRQARTRRGGHNACSR